MKKQKNMKKSTTKSKICTDLICNYICIDLKHRLHFTFIIEKK